MKTVQNIYGNLVGLRMINHKYEILKLNCENGEIEIYDSTLQKDEALEIITRMNYELIPYSVFVEEAKRLHKYLDNN